MNSTTQMMKINGPKLFYWYRKAFGLFFLFVLACCDAQTTLVGDVVMINKTEGSAVYISVGTYVHTSENIKKNKDNKTVNIACKTAIRKKDDKSKLTVCKEKIAKPVYSYHYHFIPAQNREILSSYSAARTAFITNNDHHKKQLVFVVNCLPANIFRLPASETFTKAVSGKLEYFYHQFRTRPPPVLNTI